MNKNERDAGPKDSELLVLSGRLYSTMKTRRSVRSFSKRPIPKEVIIHCISIAASAPSGANMQPWSFVLVMDPHTKKKIRQNAEEVERIFYSKKITEEWHRRLKPLKTNARKPFLEDAPYLICIFVQQYGLDDQGNRIKHYYPLESVGIATGFLISSLHQLGISTLTYTPAPMGFLSELLGRPENERPYMILVVGYPKDGYEPPRLEKKEPADYLTIIETPAN